MALPKQLKKASYSFSEVYEKITTSIAFIPMVMAIFFFLFTGLMVYLETQGLTGWMSDRLPSFLLIQSWDVALSILTVLVGALISLMVFSFSMVMVLLNNAASNFSPRLLPSLIADKFHQIVLGTYLGSITYCLLMAVNMTPEQNERTLPGLSVLVGILLGVVCLFLFIFFIHSISQSVQVMRIIESLYTVTKENMLEENLPKTSAVALPADAKYWHRYPADRFGYLKQINHRDIHDICSTLDMKLLVLIPKCNFVLRGSFLFACSKPIDHETESKILDHFVFSKAEQAKDGHIIGFKQINEIAVKAMSPGINDPGTALTCINYLSILFAEKMKLEESGGLIFNNQQGKEAPCRVWLSSVKFENLLYTVLAPLRQYARHDVLVMTKMLDLLNFLITRTWVNNQQHDCIVKEIETIRIDAKEYLTNRSDFEKIEHLINKIPSKFGQLIV